MLSLMCLSWVRLVWHVSVLLNPPRRNTGAYCSSLSCADIAYVGHFKNLLVPSYDVTFGAVGTCALVGSCMSHMLSHVVRCVDLRWGLCLAMLSVGTR